jgi:hypothetical protein
MTKELPGRPIRNKTAQRLEKFHIYLLLVLGVGLVGTGVAIIGFAVNSPAAIGVGAGGVVGAGFISIFFALVGSRLEIEEKRMLTDADPAASLFDQPDVL